MKYLFLAFSYWCLIGCDGFLTNSSSGKDNIEDNESRENNKPVATKPEVPRDEHQEEDELPTPQPPIEIPNCETYCAKNEDLIKSNQDGYSYLAFANFGYRGIGRCRGHALLTQKMSILAGFDNEQTCNISEQKCLKILKDGIRKVINFETFSFPGVENLYELSQIPEIMLYMRNYVKSVGHRYSASPVKINSQYKKRSLKVFYELKKRVLKGQLPYVGVVGRQTGSHALLVYEVDYVGSKDVLCVRDPNIVLGESENCESYVYVENNDVFYKRFDRSRDLMKKFELTSDEDRRIGSYINALHKQCLIQSKINGECK